MKPCAIPKQPWDVMHIDCAGPFPTSLKGNRYFVIAVDRLTTYCEATCLSHKDPELIAMFILEHVVGRYSDVRIEISDNGGEFCNKVRDAIHAINSTVHIKCTPYRPQGNGKAESHVKKMKKGMKAAVLKKRGDYRKPGSGEDKAQFDWGREWDTYGVFIVALMGLRFNPRMSTGYSPLMEMTGKCPMRARTDAEHHDNDDFAAAEFTSLDTRSFKTRFEWQQTFRARCKKSMRLAAGKMKIKYHKRMGVGDSANFKAGVHVLYRIGQVSKYKVKNAMYLPTDGYCVITSIRDGGFVELDVKNMAGETVDTETSRIWNLKLCTRKATKASPRKRKSHAVKNDDESEEPARQKRRLK